MSDESQPAPLRLRPRKREGDVEPPAPVVNPVSAPESTEPTSALRLKPKLKLDPEPTTEAQSSPLSVPEVSAPISKPPVEPIQTPSADTPAVTPRLKLKIPATTTSTSEPAAKAINEEAPPLFVPASVAPHSVEEPQAPVLPALAAQEAATPALLPPVATVPSPVTEEIPRLVTGVPPPPPPIAPVTKAPPPVSPADIIKAKASKKSKRLRMPMLVGLLVVIAAAGYFFVLRETEQAPVVTNDLPPPPPVTKPVPPTPAPAPEPAPTPPPAPVVKPEEPQVKSPAVATVPEQSVEKDKPIEPVAAKVEPPKPKPIVISPAFRLWVDNVRISGVILTGSPKAIINGRLARPGDLLDADQEIVFDRVDAERSMIMFRNKAGAFLGKSY